MKTRFPLMLAAGLTLVTPAILAEPAKGGADAGLAQTLRKAQGMVRQLSQEKADLEAKVQAMETQVKDLEAKAAKVAPLETQLKDTQASVENLTKSVKTLDHDKKLLERDKAHLTAEGEKLREGIATQKEYIEEQNAKLKAAAEQYETTSGELEQNRQDNQLLVNAVKERTRWIQECTGKNQSLVKANRELLQKFADEGVWDRVKVAEPFTGIGKVKRENAVQDFEFKLEDLQVTPWQELPGTPARLTAPPSP